MVVQDSLDFQVSPEEQGCGLKQKFGLVSVNSWAHLPLPVRASIESL
jgi:hypothetical protein